MRRRALHLSAAVAIRSIRRAAAYGIAVAMLVMGPAAAAVPAEQERLACEHVWNGRGASVWSERFSLPTIPRVSAATERRVLAAADEALGRAPKPVAALASAGVVDLSDPALRASRAAFDDADDTLLLALAWRLAGRDAHRDAAIAHLRAWARTYVPSGHPIDETRLDGLVNARILLGDALAGGSVDAWLARLRDAKRAWAFGERTVANNHRTHQLKSLLLLDRALGDTAAGAADRAAAEAHAVINLDAATGESVDLRERHALRYHVYDLEAWLEIALLTGCCRGPVDAAWGLLERRLRAANLGGEFVGSVSPLDARRGAAGHGYGSPGSRFDPHRALRAAYAYRTLTDDPRDPVAEGLVPGPVTRRDLYVLTRWEAWTR